MPIIGDLGALCDDKVGHAQRICLLLDCIPEWGGDCPSRMELVDTISGALPITNQKLIWRRSEAWVATDAYTSV